MTEARIRQGIKSSVPTTPMPVRLQTDQIKMLKILAALEGTTSSAIIRDCISAHLEQKLKQNLAFGDAVRSILDRL
jgi:predicted DNA-binding protein